MKRNKAGDLLKLRQPIAEGSVLAAMIRDSGFAAMVLENNTIDAECFGTCENEYVFLAIAELMKGIEPIDPVSVSSAAMAIAKREKDNCQITPDYVANLRGEYSNAEGYLAILNKYKWMRSMGDIAFWFVGSLQDSQNVDSMYLELTKKLQELEPNRARNTSIVYGWETPKFFIHSIEEKQAQTQSGNRKVFDFPWPQWNRYIPPMVGGMIFTLYGPTKAGKSTYFDHVAEHWAKGAHVLLIHLEDSHATKLNRRSARHSDVPFHVIHTGTSKGCAPGVMTEEDQNSLAIAEEKIQEEFGQRLHYYHAPGATAEKICQVIREEHGKGLCDAVVIDYLDKIQPSTSQMRRFGSDQWSRQGDDLELIKITLESLEIPGFTGGQETKAGQDSQEMGMDTIAGSAAKLHKAQVIAMFKRKRVGEDGLWDKDKQIAAPGSLSPIIEFAVLAQNLGDACQFKQVIHGARYTINDPASAQRPEAEKKVRITF